MNGMAIGVMLSSQCTLLLPFAIFLSYHNVHRVPGHEIAGIVTAVGSAVTKFTPGQRAGIGCFVDSCRNCDECRSGDDQYCGACVTTYNGRYKHPHCGEEYNNGNPNQTYGGSLSLCSVFLLPFFSFSRL
jgi:Zn-dependent alcohol dehydrogenase